MKFNGEQVVWRDMNGTNGEPDILIAHLERYLFAMKFIQGKKVLDAAAGTCYGSWMLSMLAREVISADISQESLDEGKTLPYVSKHSYLQADFNKDILPEADVCVALETIEHLDTKFFLENLKVKELIFSIPLNPIVGDAIITNPYHTKIFLSAQDAVNHICKGGWMPTQVTMQGDRYVLGRAVR